MSEFLYLFRGGIDNVSTTSPEQMQAQMQKWIDWMEQLGKQGKMQGGKRLSTDGKVLKGQSAVITDGPFAEGKEVVGGFLLVNAKDLDEAVTLSKGCPIYQVGGSVEVRETMA